MKSYLRWVLVVAILCIAVPFWLILALLEWVFTLDRTKRRGIL